jgi:hypothetical protein
MYFHYKLCAGNERAQFGNHGTIRWVPKIQNGFVELDVASYVFDRSNRYRVFALRLSTYALFPTNM